MGRKRKMKKNREGVRKEMVTKRETERRKRIRYRERGGGKERKGKTKKNR